MRLRPLICLLAVSMLCIGIGFSAFDPPVKGPYSYSHRLKDYVPPVPYNKTDEPFAKEFSLEKAAQFLDNATLDWKKGNACFTCHTDIPYLYGRPLVSGSGDDPVPREIRQALEDVFLKEFEGKGKGPGGFYAVSQATALAINDSITTKKLHPTTKRALDHMWTVQKSGGMPWGGGEDPTGSAYFGAAIVGIAVAVAPEGYAQTETAQKGIAKLRHWLAKKPPKKLYDKALILWASGYQDGFMTPEERSSTLAELREKQFADGGWSINGLGANRRDSKSSQEGEEERDGYATGLCILAMRQAGVSAQDSAIKRGIAWLKANQRESGRWLIHADLGLTNTGSVLAVMAIQSCAETPAVLSLSDMGHAP